jgi:hypothetical protein
MTVKRALEMSEDILNPDFPAGAYSINEQLQGAEVLHLAARLQKQREQQKPLLEMTKSELLAELDQ